jgi:WXG100 family type VII secretion target
VIDVAEIRVNFAGVEMAAQDIRKTAEAINLQLADLKKFLAPLAATWSGEAAGLYQERQRVWDGAQAGQQAQLARMAGLADAAAIGYRQVDKRAGAYFR